VIDGVTVTKEMYLGTKEFLKSIFPSREQFIAYAELRGKSQEFIDRFDNPQTRPSPDRVRHWLRLFMESTNA
jgi:hypothetical protein